MHEGTRSRVAWVSRMDDMRAGAEVSVLPSRADRYAEKDKNFTPFTKNKPTGPGSSPEGGHLRGRFLSVPFSESFMWWQLWGRQQISLGNKAVCLACMLESR